MEAATLTKLADALLEGRATVHQTDAYLAVHGVYRQRPLPDSFPAARSLVEDCPTSAHQAEGSLDAPCECDRDEDCRALFMHRDGVQMLPDWRETAAGLAAYNRVPRWQRSEWLRSGTVEADATLGYFRLLEYVAFVEENCKAASHYRTVSLDVELGKPVETSNEKQVANTESWNQTERDRLAWPVVSFEPGDAERGFRADPTWRKSAAGLEREYGKPRTYTVTDFDRDNDPRGSYIRLNDDGSRREVRREVTTMGSVEWEYHRRSQRDQFGKPRQPWMHKSTYKWMQEKERGRELRKRQRSAIIRLMGQLGIDPTDERVKDRVLALGYEATLDRLHVRAGVAA